MEKWLFALVALLVGGRAAVRSFERGAADDIRSHMATPRQGDVDLKVKPRFSLDGSLYSATFTGNDFTTDGLILVTQPEYSRVARIDHLRLDLSDVNITGLDVRRLQADIPGCRYDKTYGILKKRIRLTHSGLGWGRVEVTARALADFAQRKHSFITGLDLHLHDGKVTADGNAAFLGSTSRFHIEGELVAEDGTKLVLTNARVRLNGRWVSEDVAREFIKRFNPVIDEDKDLKLLDTLYIRQLTLKDDVLIAVGDTKIPVRPKKVTDE